MSTANAKHAENRRKLTRAEKKEIAALIQAAKGDGKAHTAQQTIPYLAMYPDGICKVTEKKYSKSIAYDDINYQLAQADDKTAIFENWCDFLNYFDATVSVQLSFINRGTRSGGAKEVVAIPAQNDAFNSIRTEYADMLKHQLAKGNNGFVKSKYITFSVEADNLNAAKARLARIETDILNNFKVLGAAARPMTGYERLEALHSVFHPEGEPFRFSWDWLTPSGLTTKDFIAPSSFRFGEGRYFRMGRKIGAVSFLEILAPELNDRMLAILLFAFFHAKNEEMPKPNAEKKKHRNLRRSQWLYARKNGGFYSPAVSFLTSCIAFAVAVITVKSLLSMLSSNVSSCRRCVDLSVSLFGKKNWSTETSKSVTSS